LFLSTAQTEIASLHPPGTNWDTSILLFPAATTAIQPFWLYVVIPSHIACHIGFALPQRLILITSILFSSAYAIACVIA
jgi:hypothetical protein